MAENSETGEWLLASALECTTWREEAACWLLAEHGFGGSHWPDQLRENGLTHLTVVEDEEGDLLRVQWDQLARVLEDEHPRRLYGSPSQMCVLRFACHLVTGRGGDWAAGLTSLDAGNKRLLHGALAWAGGGQSAAYPFFPADQRQ